MEPTREFDAAAALLGAAVRAGGSRHVVAATASALWRALVAGGGQAAAAGGAEANEFHWLLEHVLAAAAEAAESPRRLSVPAVKGLLRDAGHAELAARTARLSRLRIAVAHPDVGLAEAVRRALCYGSACCRGTAEMGMKANQQDEVFVW